MPGKDIAEQRLVNTAAKSTDRLTEAWPEWSFADTSLAPGPPMPDISSLQKGVRLVARTPEELEAALRARRLELKRIADERRPAHAGGRLTDIADGVWSQTTVDALRRLGAVGVQLNATWAQLPPGWTCPCCRRPKGDLIFVSGDGVAIAQAVEHHDHVVGYVNHAFHGELGRDWSKSFPAASEVQRRLAASVIGFDPTVVCEPCNHAEGQAKALLWRRLGVGKAFLEFFSFAPDEIRRFIRPSRNAHHRIDEAALLAVFEEGRKREVMTFRRENVDTQARLVKEGTHWRSPEIPAPDAFAVQEAYNDALLEFGMEAGANFSLCDLSATDQGLRMDPDAWMSRPQKRGGVVLEQEAERFLGSDSAAVELGRDWRCPCCSRSIQAAIRRNNKRQLTLQPRQVRPGGGDAETVCIDCHTAMLQVAGSAGCGRDDVLYEDVQKIFAFRANEAHRVRSADAARGIVDDIRTRAAAAREAHRAYNEAQRGVRAATRPGAAPRHRRATGRGGLY